MTTIRVNILMMLILTLPVAQAQEDLSASEKQYSDRVNQACDLKISFDLHDFEYGRDETQVYSNLHFEDTSLISGHLAEACKVNPENRNKIARVGTIFVKRGSINDRKLIQRKNGDLVYHRHWWCSRC